MISARAGEAALEGRARTTARATSALENPKERASAPGRGAPASSSTNSGASLEAASGAAGAAIACGRSAQVSALVTGKVAGIAVHRVCIPVDVGPQVVGMVPLEDSGATDIFSGGARPTAFFLVVAGEQPGAQPGVEFRLLQTLGRPAFHATTRRQNLEHPHFAGGPAGRIGPQAGLDPGHA